MTGIKYTKSGPGVDRILSYEDAFDHSRKTDCPVTSCSIMTSGSCNTALTQTNLILDTSSPFKVAGKDTVTAGYKQGFCYRCKQTPVDGSAAIETDKDGLSIQGYADCSDSLVEKKVSIQAIKYDKAGTVEDKIPSFEDIFDHTKKTDCPVESCALMTSGSCGVALTQTNIILDAKSPYKVSGKANIEVGYTQSFCYSCKVKPAGSSSTISISRDALKIRAYADCTNSLAAKAGDLVFTEINFDKQGSGIVKISDYEHVFSHVKKKKTDCPVTSCSIMTSGKCTEALI